MLILKRPLILSPLVVLNIDPLITDRLNLDDIKEGFRFFEKREARMKVVLSP